MEQNKHVLENRHQIFPGMMHPFTLIHISQLPSSYPIDSIQRCENGYFITFNNARFFMNDVAGCIAKGSRFQQGLTISCFGQKCH